VISIVESGYADIQLLVSLCVHRSAWLLGNRQFILITAFLPTLPLWSICNGLIKGWLISLRTSFLGCNNYERHRGARALGCRVTPETNVNSNSTRVICVQKPIWELDRHPHVTLDRPFKSTESPEITKRWTAES